VHILLWLLNEEFEDTKG